LLFILIISSPHRQCSSSSIDDSRISRVFSRRMT
jgi:hypothetical protein